MTSAAKRSAETESESLLAAPRRRGRPRLEDVAEIDSQLVSVALREFVASGYAGTSTNQIIRAAGVSKTTFYQRFSTKADLFRAIMRKQIEGLAPMTAHSLKPGKDKLRQGLVDYAERALRFSLKGELLEVNRLVYSEASRFPELAEAAADATRVGIEQVAEFIRNCAEADGMTCRAPEAAAEAFIFMLRGWYANIMLTNVAVRSADRKLWVERSVDVLLAGRQDW